MLQEQYLNTSEIFFVFSYLPLKLNDHHEIKQSNQRLALKLVFYALRVGISLFDVIKCDDVSFSKCHFNKNLLWKLASNFFDKVKRGNVSFNKCQLQQIISQIIPFFSWFNEQQETRRSPLPGIKRSRSLIIYSSE